MVVTANYRLEALGFLVYGSGSEAIKGNFGIKVTVTDTKPLANSRTQESLNNPQSVHSPFSELSMHELAGPCPMDNI